MKTTYDTLFRHRTMQFFMAFRDGSTIRDASRKSGLCSSSSKAYARIWIQKGLLRRHGTLHGVKYIYTVKGMSLYSTLSIVESSMQQESDLWS